MSATTADPKAASPWDGFKTGLWQNEINVRDFIQQNYDPYDGDESFLVPATERTKKIWEKLNALFLEERKKACSTFRRFRARSRPTPQAISTKRMK